MEYDHLLKPRSTIFQQRLVVFLFKILRCDCLLRTIFELTLAWKQIFEIVQHPIVPVFPSADLQTVKTAILCQLLPFIRATA